ncbi:MAG: dihydrolipoyl dehydrogenase [Alphaproteobacteria bacterium]|nr:dihydrolipoyl dehydrogenase [Alphaproteobacteria bacterium]
MSNEAYDLVVIGGGPGGYVAAIRAAQLGDRVACVETRATLGGTCLNVGCIPSKALLQSSELFHEATSGLAVHGVKTGAVALDLPAMMKRKDKVVAELTGGIAFLFKKNKIEHIEGHGVLLDAQTVRVALNQGGERLVRGKRLLIATGSTVAPLPGVDIDEKRIVSSTGALTLERVPDHLVVIGAGYIGLEMGSVWRRLGAKVTVIEFLDRVTPGMDAELSKNFQRVLTKQGMVFRLATKVLGVTTKGDGVRVWVAAAAGGSEEEIVADAVLVSIGRRPYTERLGLDAAGVQRDTQGRIVVDSHFATNVAGIFAIGDVIAGPMLAHKASDDGVACVEMMHGHHVSVDYNLVPGVVYTWPEVASVGLSEEAAKSAGIDYRVGKFPFLAVSRAKVNGTTDGFFKILADAKTDRVLGVHIIGPDAGMLIHEAVLCMAFGGSAEDIALTSHAHPTLAEGLREAAMAVRGAALHV